MHKLGVKASGMHPSRYWRNVNSERQRTSHLTRLAIRSEHPCNCLWVRLGRGCKHFFNCTRDSDKGNFAVEKCFHSNLISRIQRDAVRAAFLRRLVGEAQAWKPFKIRLFKVEMTERRQIECQ